MSINKKRTSIRLSLLLIVCVINISSIIAQNTIKGVLHDENNKPVEFANAVLLTVSDSAFIQGVTTNLYGEFTFQNVDDTEKLLQLSYIGYKTLTIECKKGDLGTITLEQSGINLDEVEVVGRIPVFTLSKNNTIITKVENSLLSSSGTAVDVMRRIPGLRVIGENKIEVFGKGTPLIYINGKQSRDPSDFIHLDSRTIKSIEVINSPGTKYDATAKAVILIKTIKNTGDGIGGSIMGFGTKGKKIGNGESINLQYRENGLDLFATLNHSLARKIEEQRDNNTIFGNKHWAISDTLAQKSRNKFNNVSLGVNYVLNKNHSLGARYSFIEAGYKVKAQSNTNAYANQELFDNLLQYDSRSKLTERHYINSYYSGLIFNKINTDFNFDYMNDKSTTNQFIEELAIEEDRDITTKANAKNTLYASNLTFSFPLLSGKLSFGGEWNSINRSSRYINKEGVLDNAYSEVKENRIAGFIGYNRKIKDFFIEAGLRYESAGFDYYEDDVYKKDQSRRFNNLFPNLSLSYKLKEVNLAFDYTSKITRPDFSMLHNEIRYNNRFTFEQGNPLLRPEKNHDWSLSANYKFLLLSVDYLYTKDFITSRFKAYPENESISLYAFENVKKSRALLFCASASPKFGIWEPVLSVNVRKPFYEIEYRGERINLNKPVAFINFSNNIRLPLGFIFSVDLDYSSKGNYSNSYMMETGGCNIGLRNTFLKNTLSVNFEVIDIFATQRDSYAFYGDINYFNKWSHKDKRQMKLSISYRFNAARNKYKGKGAIKEDARRL